MQFFLSVSSFRETRQGSTDACGSRCARRAVESEADPNHGRCIVENCSASSRAVQYRHIVARMDNRYLIRRGGSGRHQAHHRY